MPCRWAGELFEGGWEEKKPVVEGHVLVSPLRNVPKLADLSQEEVSDLFLLVQTVETFLEKYYGVSSTTISIQSES